MTPQYSVLTRHVLSRTSKILPQYTTAPVKPLSLQVSEHALNMIITMYNNNLNAFT